MTKDLPPIKRVEILGLYGNRDVSLEFEFPIKILVDENGSGKTTVIFLLVNILQGNWIRVRQYDFKEIKIQFQKNEWISFKDEEFREVSLDDTLWSALQTRVPRDMLVELIEQVHHFAFSETRRRGTMDLIASEVGMDARELYERIRHNPRFKALRGQFVHQRTLFDVGGSDALQKKLIQVQQLFPHRILYFPTYRLVEENIRNLEYVRAASPKSSEQPIQFGMRSVSQTFKGITDEIRKSSVEWFTKINGRMLDQLVDGLQRDSVDYSSIEKPEALRIVLDRIGENIRTESKGHILKLVESGKIRDPEFVALAYFLSNLIKIYEKQRTYDDSIKAFVNIANEYLSDKQIDYNESKVEINVVNERTEKKISLERLSSGEKQIVSIFSRLYLETSSPYAIFFDEPELSLSMEWQKKLLKHIVNSERCAFLIAATHSPFIFENELAKYADILKIEFNEGNNEPS